MKISSFGNKPLGVGSLLPNQQHSPQNTHFSFRRGSLEQNLIRMRIEIAKILEWDPKRDDDNEDVIFSDLSLNPKYWVCKWFYNEIGLGYQLSDKTVSAVIIDETSLLVVIKAPDKAQVEFFDGNGNIITLQSEVKGIEILQKLLFFMYMLVCKDTSVIKCNDGSIGCRNNDNTQRLYVHTFWKSQDADVFHMTNGVMQINFHDEIKILICLNNNSLTVIDHTNCFRSYNLNHLQANCPAFLHQRLMYLKVIIDDLIQYKIY